MENAVHVQLNSCYVTSMQSLTPAAPLAAPVTPGLSQLHPRSSLSAFNRKSLLNDHLLNLSAFLLNVYIN